jgi:serine O-acetyltransferase
MSQAFPIARADIRRYFAEARRFEFPDAPPGAEVPTAGVGGWLRTLRLVAAHYSLQALLVYRLGHWLRSSIRRPARWIPALVSGPLYLLLVAFIRVAYDVHLASSAAIGPGFFIGHFGGVRVGRCRIGAHCSIHQRVLVGPGPVGGPGPSIGDRVWIGPHARILGPFQIGDGATIGGGAEVTHDVCAGALLLGNPARVVSLHYDNGVLL